MAESSRPQKGGGNTVAVCRELALPFAEQLGLILWDVRFVKEGASWYLRYLIDKEGGVTIDDCVALSRLINPVLDEADPISQSYCLEVMSPGIERELTRPEHFEAYLDCAVVVKTIRPIDGEREFAGILTAYDEDGTVHIVTEDETPLTFEKKMIVLVHAIDEWDEEE
ncbi:MAG: ribosome maturation factor RimP [Clostridia bacterium]|nr:ribosome maturation factor RimP [Clostridia bacterium]